MARLIAEPLRRRVVALRRKLAAAEEAYRAALEADAIERGRRAEARRQYLEGMDQRKRARIIARAEARRPRKAPWHERARMRLLHPTIG